MKNGSGWRAVVLAPARAEITLDDALLDGMKTFENGCNFRLTIKDYAPHLDYGCYGVHVNLVQGNESRLMEWLGYGKKYQGEKRLDVHPKTLVELMARIPCKECGGIQFKETIAPKPPIEGA